MVCGPRLQRARMPNQRRQCGECRVHFGPGSAKHHGYLYCEHQERFRTLGSGRDGYRCSISRVRERERAVTEVVKSVMGKRDRSKDRLIGVLDNLTALSLSFYLFLFIW